MVTLSFSQAQSRIFYIIAKVTTTCGLVKGTKARIFRLN